MKQVSNADLFELPVGDRIRLAIELLESIADDDDNIVSEHDKAILDKCIADDEANPGEGITWNELEKRLNRKAKRKR